MNVTERFDLDIQDAQQQTLSKSHTIRIAPNIRHMYRHIRDI